MEVLEVGVEQVEAPVEPEASRLRQDGTCPRLPECCVCRHSPAAGGAKRGSRISFGFLFFGKVVVGRLQGFERCSLFDFGALTAELDRQSLHHIAELRFN